MKPSRLQKRRSSEFQAAIDDLFFSRLAAWEDYCRARSSTGENMIKESMGEDGYAEFRKALLERCTNDVKAASCRASEGLE